MAESRATRSPIAIRLALAAVGIAVGAVALLAVLTLVAAIGDVNELARQQQERSLAATAAVVGEAYRIGGSWGATDLRDAAALAAQREVTLAVFDQSGRAVPVPPIAGANPPIVPKGPVRSTAVTVDGQRLGTVVVHFYAAALPTSDRQLLDALTRRVAAGAGLSALLALGVAVFLSRRITRPIVELTVAVRALESGDRHVRVRPASATTGELADLASAFNRMAATIERENELRRAVVSDVAHELRTPLAILQAGCEAIADGLVAPSPDNLASLQDEVLRLARTVDDLDTLATAEAAALRMDRCFIDITEPVRRAVKTLAPSFAEAGVEFTTDLDPTQAFADPHRLEQVVTNLLTNALKFSEPGATVTISVKSAPDGAVVEVADTGIGIAADELPHVFERFWRGRHAGRLAGSGIGLAVVHALVDAHDGTVTIESTPSEGTHVRVVLPTNATPVHPAPPTPEPDGLGTGRG